MAELGWEMRQPRPEFHKAAPNFRDGNDPVSRRIGRPSWFAGIPTDV